MQIFKHIYIYSFKVVTLLYNVLYIFHVSMFTNIRGFDCLHRQTRVDQGSRGAFFEPHFQGFVGRHREIGPPFCWETPGFRPAEKCELSRCLWVVGENFWWISGGIFGSQATRQPHFFGDFKRRHSQYPSYKKRNKFLKLVATQMCEKISP